jgi:signal transduction histidine kinase
MRKKEALDLRKAAEAILESGKKKASPPGDFRKVLHELNVHQIELEMQNEELRASRDLLFMRESPRLIAECADRLIEFVEKTLKLARLGPGSIDAQELDLITLIAELFVRLKPPDISAELKISESLPQMMADKMAMEQIFGNLISNAFKYRSPKKKKVWVEVWHEESAEAREIFFKDNGEGIPRGKMDQLFQINAAEAGNESGGFGLAIVKKLLESMGGRIRVEDPVEGKGALFILSFPHRPIGTIYET